MVHESDPNDYSKICLVNRHRLKRPEQADMRGEEAKVTRALQTELNEWMQASESFAGYFKKSGNVVYHHNGNGYGVKDLLPTPPEDVYPLFFAAVGDRVTSNPPRGGSTLITSITQDNNSEVGVKGKDNIWCGKKGRFALLYA
ncbi:hypothetical protein KIPB_001340 [Kipferlia bialata]|uniref:Uncharacterized protein n=1 Tax=Kipferlia bialata TaxID=797122 RepID=A0A9K3CQJ9_9EUKA|nr:hypothetical protein KIPB_001340 [Kipferlia bialata]|eukprot:g1340.t1